MLLNLISIDVNCSNYKPLRFLDPVHKRMLPCPLPKYLLSSWSDLELSADCQKLQRMYQCTTCVAVAF